MDSGTRTLEVQYTLIVNNQIFKQRIQTKHGIWQTKLNILLFKLLKEFSTVPVSIGQVCTQNVLSLLRVLFEIAFKLK